MNAVGLTRRGFLGRLVAAGAVAVAGPALRALDLAEEAVELSPALLAYVNATVPQVLRKQALVFFKADPVFDKLRGLRNDEGARIFPVSVVRRVLS